MLHKPFWNTLWRSQILAMKTGKERTRIRLFWIFSSHLRKWMSQERFLTLWSSRISTTATFPSSALPNSMNKDSLGQRIITRSLPNWWKNTPNIRKPHWTLKGTRKKTRRGLPFTAILKKIFSFSMMRSELKSKNQNLTSQNRFLLRLGKPLQPTMQKTSA